MVQRIPAPVGCHGVRLQEGVGETREVRRGDNAFQKEQVLITAKGDVLGDGDFLDHLDRLSTSETKSTTMAFNKYPVSPNHGCRNNRQAQILHSLSLPVDDELEIICDATEPNPCYTDAQAGST
jgi:hypothetical protein